MRARDYIDWNAIILEFAEFSYDTFQTIDRWERGVEQVSGYQDEIDLLLDAYVRRFYECIYRQILELWISPRSYMDISHVREFHRG